MFTLRLRAFLDACFSNGLLSRAPNGPDTPATTTPARSSLTVEEIHASRQERLRGLGGIGKETAPK
jgi:hypothetical protein